MTGIEIDGQMVANKILQKVAVDVDALKQDGWGPTLVSIRIGDNSAVDRYLRNPQRNASKVGIDFV